MQIINLKKISFPIGHFVFKSHVMPELRGMIKAPSGGQGKYKTTLSKEREIVMLLLTCIYAKFHAVLCYFKRNRNTSFT